MSRRRARPSRDARARRRAKAGTNLEASDNPSSPGDATLSWAEVNRTHRVRNGVYHRAGRLVSLLTDFGRINPCYPDRHDDSDPDTIHYVGEGRRGDQQLTPGNRALLAAVESGHAVPLFDKLGPGRWRHTGHWCVVSAEHRFDPWVDRMLWRFTLKRTRRVPAAKRGEGAGVKAL